jgi:DNA-binding LacI/PurR family transcriptional regulator
MADLQKRATLMDVAETAGVSRALVSIVMRGAPGAAEATRKKVLEAADSLGYRPDSRARLLRSSRTKLLGLSFSSSEAFHTEIVDAAYAEATERGYEIVLSAVASGRPERRAIESLLDFGVEALILISPSLGLDELRRIAQKVPLVSLLRKDAGDSTDSVSSDDHAGITLAMEHLTSLGHTRIVHVDGGTAVSAAERRSAYEAEMLTRGLQPVVIPGGPTEEDGMSAGQTLGPSIPTAVIAFNDRAALGLLESMRLRGLNVPEDISIVGYDDSQFARLSYVQLTSVSQDAPLLAAAAVDRAVDRVEGRQQPGREIRTPHLVVRNTTTVPRPSSN